MDCIYVQYNRYVLWKAGICPIAEILRKSASLMKSDNRLLSCGQKRFQYCGRPPSWICCDIVMLRKRTVSWAQYCVKL